MYWCVFLVWLTVGLFVVFPVQRTELASLREMRFTNSIVILLINDTVLIVNVHVHGKWDSVSVAFHQNTL